MARPEGAFYAFLRVTGVTDSAAFAKELLARTKVGLAPGSAFGAMGEGYLRLCFARAPAGNRRRGRASAANARLDMTGCTSRSMGWPHDGELSS